MSTTIRATVGAAVLGATSIGLVAYNPSTLGTEADGFILYTLDEARSLLAAPAAMDIPTPTTADKHMLFRTPVALTVSRIFAVLAGSSTPSVTYSIRYGSDWSGSGTEVVTGGSTVTSVTTGSSVTTFNSATIPAGSLVWLTVGAQSGTVTELHVTVAF